MTMVNGSIRSKVPGNLRRLNYAAPSVSSLLQETMAPRKPSSFSKNRPTPTPTSTATTSAVDDGAAGIDLTDTKRLFASISTGKLLKSTAAIHASSFGPMVDLGTAVMNSRLMENPLARKVILDATEHTFYSHFCAGKDLDAAAATLSNLWDAGLSAMMDYGLEHADNNHSCDLNLHEFLRTIEWTKLHQPGQVSFVVVKITAICPVSLLKRVSDLLRWENKDKSLNLPWKLESLPIFSDSSPLYHTPAKPESLTPEEEKDLGLAFERLTKICDHALQINTPLLIDAEDTSIQPAIDYFSYSAAVKYSAATCTGEKDPLIFNTIQAYLKDAKDRLAAAKKAADGMRVPVGFKLVRGAYMSSENRLAASLGAETPIHDTIQKTHNCYNECASFLLDEISGGGGSVVLATHNIESSKLAASKAVSLGIKKDSPCLQFAQLYGMSEALSFGLKNAGFRVSKYLPFGPVDQIMPYLMRRAEENRGMLSTSATDKMLMRKELMRRLRSPASWF
ncbi:hypothetical protein ACP275_08G037800 [Erythranthe tilingii]